MKSKTLILLLLAFLSVNSFADYISVGAIWHDGIGDTYESWHGTVHIQTTIDYWLESNTGTHTVVYGSGFSETAGGGQWKQGTREVYPGDHVGLIAEIYSVQPGYNIATATIYVHKDNAIY